MTGQTRNAGQEQGRVSLGTLDAESVERIDIYLQRALAADDADEKDFHVRHARQLLEGCRE